MKLIPLYKAILASMNLVVDENGFVSTNYGQQKAAKIGGKRVVLPTSENLRSEDWESQIIFHPLREAVTSGESSILEWLRKAGTVRLNLVAYFLFHQILAIAGSPARHKELTPDQSGFLSILDKVEQRTLTDWENLMAAMPFDQTAKSFVHFYLKRAGKIGNRTFDRAGIVNFPLYEELKKHEKGEVKIFGVSTRAKDRQTYIKMMEYVFPNIGEKNAYSAGSTSQIAPYLDAFVRTFFSICVPLNEQLKLLGSAIPDSEEMITDDSWVSSFDNLDTLRKEIEMIPMQGGNSTSGGQDATPAQAAAPAAVAPAMPMAAQYGFQPAGGLAAAPAANKGPVDMATFMRQPAQMGVSNMALMTMGVNPMAVAQGIVPFGAPQQMPGMGMPGFGMGMPQQPQQAIPTWMYNNPQPQQPAFGMPAFGWPNNGFGR